MVARRGIDDKTLARVLEKAPPSGAKISRLLVAFFIKDALKCNSIKRLFSVPSLCSLSSFGEERSKGFHVSGGRTRAISTPD